MDKRKFEADWNGLDDRTRRRLYVLIKINGPSIHGNYLLPDDIIDRIPAHWVLTMKVSFVGSPDPGITLYSLARSVPDLIEQTRPNPDLEV